MVKIFQKTLLKRASREYKKEYFKFFILQVFLLAFIANISGYLIGTRAVDDSYNNIKESMNLEDGMFSTFYKLDDKVKLTPLLKENRKYSITEKVKLMKMKKIFVHT